MNGVIKVSQSLAFFDDFVKVKRNNKKSFLIHNNIVNLLFNSPTCRIFIVCYCQNDFFFTLFDISGYVLRVPYKVIQYFLFNVL